MTAPDAARYVPAPRGLCRPGVSIPALCLLVLCVLGLRGAFAADLYDIDAATPPRVVDARYFGTHLHRAVPSSSVPGPVTPWPMGQVATLRLWDSTTRWADLEPAPGDFRFDRLDAYMTLAARQHVSVVMVLGSPPRWAAARPDEAGPYGLGSASEPARLADWDRYVTSLTHRYRGRIARYELWNEPYFSDLAADRGQPAAFFSGSVATMVELARRTRAVLDREDPDAVLLTPGFVGSPVRLDMFLAAGGNAFVGGVAYHFYADDDRGFVELYRQVRAVMQAHGIADLPLLDTESGFAVAADSNRQGGDDRAARAAAAELLARSMILGAYLGVDRFYQYAWDNERSGMLAPRSLAPTPSASAYAAVRRWLLGTTLTGCRLEAGGLVHCRGTRGPDRLSIRWQASSQQQASPVSVPALWSAVSIEYASDPGRTRQPGRPGLSHVEVGSDPVAVWWRPPASGAKP